MFDPFGDDQDEKPAPRPPFPSPTTALLLTFGASFAALVISVVIFEEPDVASLGIGEALGVGGVATLAARRVPEPQAERLGLRGFSPRLLPLLLCLVPFVFLASELDNWARDLDAHLPSLVPEAALEAPENEESSDSVSNTETESSGELALDTEFKSHSNSESESDEEPASGVPAHLTDPPEGWELAQIAIVAVGIAPVVEGFLFFGVILQGLVTVIGRRRGLILTGCLYAMIHIAGQVGLDAGPARAFAGLFSMIVVGAILGICRLETGSVLAPILVATGFVGVQLAAVTMPDVFAVPGYNVELDAHTPAHVLLTSLAAVTFGLWALGRQGQPPLPPIGPIQTPPRPDRREG